MKMKAGMKKVEPMMSPPPEMQRMMSMMHGKPGKMPESEVNMPPKKMPLKGMMKERRGRG